MKERLAHLMLIAILASCCAFSIEAEEASVPQSGFLEDYDQLNVVPEAPTRWLYLAAGVEDASGRYDKVIVEQVEVSVAPHSKSRSLRPNDMLAISQTFQSAVIDELEGYFEIVDAPGPGVLYVRVAASDINLEKKRRILDFTPVGVVTNVVPGVKAAKEAMKSAVLDLNQRLRITGLVLEAEVMDVENNERIAAVVERLADVKSWDAVEESMRAYSRAMVCRLAADQTLPDGMEACQR